MHVNSYIEYIDLTLILYMYTGCPPPPPPQKKEEAERRILSTFRAKSVMFAYIIS